MKTSYNSTVMQVLKGVKDKRFVEFHKTMTYEKDFAAFGFSHKPSSEMKVKMTADGEFYFLVKCDETQVITGYVGEIHSVVTKDTHPEIFSEYAKRYSAYYYNYHQYNTIYLVKNLVTIPQEVVEKLLNDRSYLLDNKGKFDVNKFFKSRCSQVYLKKF